MQTLVPSTTVLVIAAAKERATLLAQQLEALGYYVLVLTADHSYQQVIGQRHYDLVIVDLYEAQAQAAQTLTTLASDLLARGTPVITLTPDQSDPSIWPRTTLHQRISSLVQRGTASDVLTERARQWDGLNVLDGETLLFNRHYFDALLPTEIARARRTHQPMTLVLLDLAHVPTDATDLWRSISTCLLTSLRQTDLVARYTPSLIAVVLPATDASLARIVAARLQKTLQTLRLPDGNPLSLTYAIAAYPQHGTTLAALLSVAQDALGPVAVPALM